MFFLINSLIICAILNVVSSIDLFLDIAKTQFFGDGNKRTGQLMMNGILIGEGYCPVVLNFRENKERRDKLIHFYETDDREPLKKIILEKQREFEIDFGINQD